MLFSSSVIVNSKNNRYSSASMAQYGFNLTGSIWLLSAFIIFSVASFYNVEVISTAVAVFLILQFWFYIFSTRSVRELIPDTYTVLNALLFTLLLPIDIPLGMLFLSVSFGVVFGERVFGGRGYSFLQPVIVGIAFYLYSQSIDPSTTAANAVPSWLIVLFAMIFILLEMVSWRTCIGLLIGLSPCAFLPGDLLLQMVGSGSILMIIIYLAVEPGSGASTNPGRWIHGVLVGLLIALLFSQNNHLYQVTVFAILLGSLCAPLFDYLIVQVFIARRGSRYD